ncbi:hypothetical protein D3C76_1603560 [compost metagenome]
MCIPFGVQRNPRLEPGQGFALAEQRVPGVDHQVDQYLFKLIDIAAHLHFKTGFADAQVDAFVAQVLGQQ